MCIITYINYALPLIIKNKYIVVLSFSLLELDPLHLDLVVDQLIHVRDDGPALDVHEDEGRRHGLVVVVGVVAVVSRVDVAWNR